MSTPGVKISYQEHSADDPLPLNLHTPFRGSAARANYLSADRIDVQYPCKEVCRSMAGPIAQSLKALKRIGRYLTGRPRLVYSFPRQDLSAIDVYVDTDWARCARTRKSTSGGAVMLGRHGRGSPWSWPGPRLVGSASGPWLRAVAQSMDVQIDSV